MEFRQYIAATRKSPACLDAWRLMDESGGALSLKDSKHLCALMVRVQNGSVGEWAGELPAIEVAVMTGEGDGSQPEPSLAAITNDPEIGRLHQCILSIAKLLYPRRHVEVISGPWGDEYSARLAVSEVTQIARTDATEVLALRFLYSELGKKWQERRQQMIASMPHWHQERSLAIACGILDVAAEITNARGPLRLMRDDLLGLVHVSLASGQNRIVGVDGNDEVEALTRLARFIADKADKGETIP